MNFKDLKIVNLIKMKIRENINEKSAKHFDKMVFLFGVFVFKRNFKRFIAIQTLKRPRSNQNNNKKYS